MGKKAIRARVDWIARSTSLSTLNVIAGGLLAIGPLVLLIGLASGGIVVAYVGGVLLGFGMSTGIFALAVNAIVGAIARSKVD